MAKIDEIKERLNTLRLLLSISIAIFIVLTGSLVNQERNNQIDLYFWIGGFINICIMIGVFFILKSIKNNTKKIKDL